MAEVKKVSELSGDFFILLKKALTGLKIVSDDVAITDFQNGTVNISGMLYIDFIPENFVIHSENNSIMKVVDFPGVVKEIADFSEEKGILEIEEYPEFYSIQIVSSEDGESENNDFVNVIIPKVEDEEFMNLRELLNESYEIADKKTVGDKFGKILEKTSDSVYFVLNEDNKLVAIATDRHLYLVDKGYSNVIKMARDLENLPKGFKILQSSYIPQFKVAPISDIEIYKNKDDETQFILGVKFIPKTLDKSDKKFSVNIYEPIQYTKEEDLI